MKASLVPIEGYTLSITRQQVEVGHVRRMFRNIMSSGTGMSLSPLYVGLFVYLYVNTSIYLHMDTYHVLLDVLAVTLFGHQARLIQQCRVIVVDEAPMLHRYHLEVDSSGLLIATLAV